MENSNPRLRNDLEFIPVQQGQQTFVLVRDHLGLVAQGTAVPFQLYELMVHLDGAKSVRDLQMLLMRLKGGVLVGTHEVEGILNQLDESYLLDSPRFRSARDRIVDEFVASPVRECVHCGQSYPSAPGDLESYLDRVLATATSETPGTQGHLAAIVAPHIDINVGSRGYASAYNVLKGRSTSRIVILGVGHQMREGLFSLTEKDFNTPLGMVRCDKEWVRSLKEAGKDCVLKDDFPHRSEHSIEFQLLFLQHVLKGKEFKVIPILCGNLWTHLSPCERSTYLAETGEFLRAFEELLEEHKQETIVVAGVDLCHIGHKFGHQEPATSLEMEARAHDQALLDAMIRPDPERFWEESIRVKDRYNVCGFSALACMMEVLHASEGRLLHYEIWHEPPTRSAVSFCAAALFSHAGKAPPRPR